MSDLTINGLVSAHSDNIQGDKTLVPSKRDDGDGEYDEYRVNFTLRGGQTRTLVIVRRLASSNDSRGLKTLTKWHLRGDTDCDNDLDNDDCLQWDNPDPNCSQATAFNNSNAKNIFCPSGVMADDWKGIRIDEDTGDVFRKVNGSEIQINTSDIRSIGDQPTYPHNIQADVGVTPAATDVDDYFEIKYTMTDSQGNPISDAGYPLPDIGSTLNDNNRVIQDLRITDVDMDIEGKVFYLKITLQHRDFGNRYSIRIVCPYNF